MLNGMLGTLDGMLGMLHKIPACHRACPAGMVGMLGMLGEHAQ
jgi:hypothetical protein